ncbi:hypothetical protein RYZ20_14680 [Thioclava sp. A2]|nr:hypothetical protein [Thioclava sp. A2]
MTRNFDKVGAYLIENDINRPRMVLAMHHPGDFDRCLRAQFLEARLSNPLTTLECFQSRQGLKMCA